METIYIIVLFVLTLVFFALWQKEKYGGGKATRLSGGTDAGQPKPEDQELDGPVTRESVVAALRYHQYNVEDPDPDDPEDVHFSYQGVWYRIKTNKLPYLSIEACYRIDEEENVDFVMQVAREITYTMYIIKVMVYPEDKIYVYQVDLIADTYLPFRDSLRKYLDVLLHARSEFRQKYDQKVEEQKQASNEVLQNTLLAAQIDAAGNKILS